MTGDRFEQAFLSKYIIDLGYSDSQASRVIATYGLIVALASWMSGVLAEVFSPRRLMTLAFIIWIIFHVGFLTLGLAQQNYAMMIIMYDIRGFTQEGILRSDECLQGEFSDSYVYSLLREEYENGYK